MWSNWQNLWQVKGYQRLALAIVLSLLVHLLLLGKLELHLPVFSKQPHIIEARLLVANPMHASAKVKPELKKALQPRLVLKKVVRSKPISAKPESVSPVPPLPVVEESTLPSSAADNVISDIGHVVELPLPVASDPLVEPVQQDVPVEPRVEVNHHAYKYVETEFDVRTESKGRMDASPAGTAKMVYQLLPNGEQYQLKSLIQGDGLLALFIPDLLQTSDGFVTSAGLQPQHYLYQFGNRKNKTFSADFNWEHRKLQLNSSTGTSEVALVDGTQDLLSFMYQFMFIPPLENMHLNITNGKKLGSYDYSFEGEETITTEMGSLSTLHIIRTTSEGDEKTELWLALDYQYVPVKIRKTEKEDKVYELLATSLKTEKPATQPE
ncbi:hypothetical protein GALL_315890 [mine drainage metagenome]|uniref:DUF3108 domain-containing protein n=1 Tax=mine drainage metagenome TaxID=410659 RepID=A0A1J5QSW6_9ZZZZ